MSNGGPNGLQGILVGHGVDIVELDDFSRLLKEPARAFLNRHFTQTELADAGGGATQIEKLAGRLAVKEAVMKALGVGWGDGIAFTDVEVVTLQSGAPTVTLHRKIGALELERKISGWFISISHTRGIAMASAIAVCSLINVPVESTREISFSHGVEK
ncbi:holo-ACP synthase [Massilia rhizosphaerae]|uniref:holo-ACP synthase n=1 Tax=Massilia rhizosphaerae TaxID=2784389 RepID=UPI0018DC4B59|nr:holo-ACP synthase [Massilia rhizosphaerae]